MATLYEQRQKRIDRIAELFAKWWDVQTEEQKRDWAITAARMLARKNTIASQNDWIARLEGLVETKP